MAGPRSRKAGRPARPAAPGRPRRIGLGTVLAGVLALAAVASAAAIWWPWDAFAPRPPEVDTGGLDPDVAAAVAAARGEVLDSPRSAGAWGRLGMVLYANDLLDHAGPCLLEAQRLDAKDPRWPYLYGLLQKANRPAEAVPYLEQAADLAGDNPVPRLQLADVLYGLGRADDAAAQYRRVLDKDSDNPRAHLGLGRIDRDRGDLAAARDHATRAAARAPQQPAIRALLAETKFGEGDRQAARREPAPAADSSEPPGWPDPIVEEMEPLKVGVAAAVSRAGRRFSAGYQQEALAQMATVVRKHPDSAFARAALGRCLLAVGDLPAAEGMLRESVRLDPLHLDALFDLAMTLQRRGQYREAADWYRQAIALKPAHALAHLSLAGCLSELGDRAGAIAEVRTTIRYKPDLAGAYTVLAVLLDQDGHRPEAREALQAALRLDPHDPKAQALEARLRDH